MSDGSPGTLTLVVFILGAALFIGGDVFWVARLMRGRRPLLRITGSLIAAGVMLMTFAVFVLRPA